jgi:hypothetical protein
MSTVLADVVLIDGLLRTWAEPIGLSEAAVHQAFEEALTAMVGGASLSEAFRVGRDELDRTHDLTSPTVKEEALV